MNMEKIAQVIADITGIDEEKITMESSLRADLEIDSLDAVEIGMALEDEYGITIPQEALESFKTVADIDAFIEEAK